MATKRLLSSILGCVSLATGLLVGVTVSNPAPALGQEAVSDLKIVVLEGEEGVNILKKKTAVMPVVEVRDKNNLPVSGASVIFAVPRSGASAVFPNGARSITVMTDNAGRATVTSMKPVGTGSFKIDVTASHPNHGSTTAQIGQTNVLTALAASAGNGSGAVAGASEGGIGNNHGAVVAGVVVAAGIGVVSTVLATHNSDHDLTCVSGCK